MNDPTDVLGSAVVEHFLTDDGWPRVRQLQNELRHLGKIELVAASAGSEWLVCEDSYHEDAICRATLKGLQRWDTENVDIDHLLAAIRRIAAVVAEGDRSNIGSSEIGADLNLTDREIRRLGVLIRSSHGSWQKGGGYAPDGSWSVSPSHNIWYYEDVCSIEDLDAAEQRVREDMSAAEAHRMSSWLGGAAVSFSSASVAPEYPLDAVANEDLRALLQRDLAELKKAMDAGCTKAAAFLAGSCCEAIILDCLETSSEWIATTGSSRGRQGLGQMVSTAHRLGLISDDSKDMANFLKKWRDIIHPERAVRSREPIPPLAAGLQALLQLLLHDISTRSGT